MLTQDTESPVADPEQLRRERNKKMFEEMDKDQQEINEDTRFGQTVDAIGEKASQVPSQIRKGWDNTWKGLGKLYEPESEISRYLKLQEALKTK